MPEHKMKQYCNKVKKRNNNNNKRSNLPKENNLVNKKSKFKTTIEIKKIQDYSDDSSLIMTVKNKTLDDSNWKDSFDRLLDTRSPLRKNNIIKKDIRLSHNLDSSVNTSNEKSTNQNSSSKNSKFVIQSTFEKDLEKNKENSNSSILNETPIYKRKSFLNRFNELMNKGTRGLKKGTKKSTMSSTPLVNAAKNRKRKASKANKAAEIDMMFLMPTISPIRNEPSPLKFDKSLLKSFTGSEKKRVWKDLFGVNLSKKDENDIKKISKVKQTISQPLNRVSNVNKSFIKSMTDDVRILNNSNIDSENHTVDKSKSLLEIGVQNIFQDAEKSVQSLDISKNLSFSIQQVESILDKSLSTIEKSLSHFKPNNSSNKLRSTIGNVGLQSPDLETLNQTLQIIENTYNSILESGEIMTTEISDKFLTIEKNVDNLILNNSNRKLNLTKTSEETCTKNNVNDLLNSNTIHFAATQKDDLKNIDVDSDVHNDLNNQKNNSIFENNAFINKLKFLQNCIAISGGKEGKRSLPIIPNHNFNNLFRSNSTNTLTDVNRRFTLDSTNSTFKNTNNRLFISKNTLQNVKHARRNSLDSYTAEANFKSIEKSSASTSQNFINQFDSSTEISRIHMPCKFLQNVSNFTSEFKTSSDILNKINSKNENEILKPKKESLSNLKSKNITTGVLDSFNEKELKPKNILRKYKSENSKLISKKLKTDLQLVKKFVPLRKSLIGTNSENSSISIDSNKIHVKSDSDKNSNSKYSKISETENIIIKQTQPKITSQNQIETINNKTSIKTTNIKSNEKSKLKNSFGSKLQSKPFLTDKENTIIDIEKTKSITDLRKSCKAIMKKKSNKDNKKNKFNIKMFVKNNSPLQDNFISLKKRLRNLSLDSNETSKHSKSSYVTNEQYKNSVQVENNDKVKTENLTNSFNLTNRPIIIENILIVAPTTEENLVTLETESDDASKDNNKNISDLKTDNKININTRQLIVQPKRKYNKAKEKNDGIIILDSPPNKKLARNNKSNNTRNHYDLSNDTVHSVSSSDISIEKHSKSKKSIALNLTSKVHNNINSVQYDDASFLNPNHSSERKKLKNITDSVKEIDKNEPLIVTKTNSGLVSDESLNEIEIIETKSNVTTKRNSKQKSIMLSMGNEKSIEKRNRTSKIRSSQLRSRKSPRLTSKKDISETETVKFNNSKNDSTVDHNLTEISSNKTDTIQKSSYVTARRNSKQKSITLSIGNDKPIRKRGRPLKSCSPQSHNSSFSCLINLELETEIPFEILNTSDKAKTNLIDRGTINESLSDLGLVQRNSNVNARRNSKQKSLTLLENKEPVQKSSKVLKSRSFRLIPEKSLNLKLQIDKSDQVSINMSSKDAGFVQRSSNVTSKRNSKEKLLKLSVESEEPIEKRGKSMKTNFKLNSEKCLKTNLETGDSNVLKNVEIYTTKIIDPDLTNINSNDSVFAKRISNVTTRRKSKQKLSTENDQSKQIRISKVQNSLLNSQNSSIVNLEKQVFENSSVKPSPFKQSSIKNIENVTDINVLKSNTMDKSKLKNSINLNVSAINLSPEVSKFRTARQKSIEIRKRLARTKLPSILGQIEENKIQKPLHNIELTETINCSLNKPNDFIKLKKCKVAIKKNKNIKNNLIYKPTKDSIHCKYFENNKKVTKQQERLSVKNHRKKLPIRKLKTSLLTTEINSKCFVNAENSFNHTIPEIQLNNSVLNNDSKTITIIVDSHNTTEEITTDKSVMEISFDRDEFIKNINNHNIKKSLYHQSSISTQLNPIKQSSLSHNNNSLGIDSDSVAITAGTGAGTGALINISNNITIRDSINQRKSDHGNSSSLIIKSKNITLRDTTHNSIKKSVNNKINLMYDTLYEDLGEIQSNNNSKLLVDQSKIINNEDKIILKLSGGKWRRSLCAWKRNSISLMGKINSSQIINTEFQLQQNLSGDINKKVEISNKENTECINSGTNDTSRNSLILSSQIFNKSRSIRIESNKNLKSLSLAQTSLKDNEINFNVSQQRPSFLRKTLLLEPTDDEAPIIHKSCSLFNTFEKQSKSSSSSGNEAAETAASCVQEKQSLQLQNQQQQYLQQRTQTQLQQNFIEKSSSLQRQSKQKPPSTSAVYSEIVEETEEEEEELQIEDDDSEYNQSDGDVEYFNDRRILNKNNNSKSTNNKQKSDEIQNFLYVQRRATQSSNHQQRTSYKHQLSVPICGNRPSISILGQPSNRRRRTSFIEGFVDFNYHQEQRFLIDNFLKRSTTTVVEEVGGTVKGTEVEENKQLQKSTLHNKSSSRYIGSYENNENHIFLPTLDVSLRAQLSPRDIVLRRCQQTDPFEFSSIYSEAVLHQCRKIGEGVYGEVFMNKNQNGEAIVLKIIPIEGQVEINGEVQKNFEQILPEIIIAEELSRLRNDKKSMTSGFVEVKNVHCVQGCYPDHLIDLWELYRDNCGTENDHPEIFPEDQLYIIFELANAGQDLEAFNFQNALQSYSAFLQVALSLAVAEEKFKFEHRDLHWGNILLQSTEQKENYFKLNGKDYKIPTHGVKATIIDYTLSRMIFEGCCLYNDLSNDNELFSASGDYQFDVYRLMQKRLDNQWEHYDPYTNILWLHYTIDKMISGARYRCSKTKKHRSAIQTIMKLRDELLDYNSASDYVESFDD